MVFLKKGDRNTMNNEWLKKISIILFTGILTNVTMSYAQWNFTFSLDQEYNNNPFHTPVPEGSWVSTLQLGAEKEMKTVNFGYYGAYSHFDNIQERNFYWHQLAIWSGNDKTNWGAFIEQRINRNDFDIYNYKEIDAYLNHKFFIKGLSTIWTGRVQYNHYDQFSELNNWKLNTGFRVNKSFPTKTTIIASMNIDFKNYIDSSPEIEFVADSSTMPSNYSAASIQGETGDGNNGMMGKSDGHGGRGYRSGGGKKGFFVENSYVNFENASVVQLTIWVRLAQSVSRTTGLAIQYYRRTILSGDDRFISGIADSYSLESELFNDPMGYNSHSFGAELTKLLPANMTLKLSTYYVTRDYSSQGIYVDEENYDEFVLRSDKYKVVYCGLKKNLGFNYFGVSDLSLSLNYQWTDNESNSYWYNYRNHFGSIGIEFNF